MWGDYMKMNFNKCLNEYNHSRPIIFSHLERQYHKEFFYDELEQFGIMFTSFNLHFIFGKIPSKKELIVNTIKRYIQDKDIFIMYAPNEEWYPLLDEVFSELNGKVKRRNAYALNIEKFHEYDPRNNFVKLELLKENNSLREYPQANTYIKDKLISYCRGFMTGENRVELDVWTCEEYRQQGFAFDGCLVLIEDLLKHNLEPVWTCWDYKESNTNLAEKLGFELVQSYNAYIWKKEKR